MSVWGSITRELTVLGLEWHRTIKEDHTEELSDGWHLTVTLPFVDVTVDSHGWDHGWFERITEFIRSPKDRSYHYKNEVSALGYAVGWNLNGNEGRIRATHDASERLIEGKW